MQTDSQTGYTIKLSNFEGPLELLLALIEKRKLLINDVSLAAVTDDYLAYIKSGQVRSMGDTAHFVVVASTLLLIKSKSLLPMLSFTEEESASMEDLERRLKLYQIVRDTAKIIGARMGAAPLFAGNIVSEEELVFAPSKDLSIEALSGAAHNLLKALPAAEPRDEAIVEQVVSLEEMIDRLTARVEGALQMSFREFAGADPTKRVEIVVSFLAMLELVKEGLISVEQDARFGDIMMEKDVIDTPKYA